MSSHPNKLTLLRPTVFSEIKAASTQLFDTFWANESLKFLNCQKFVDCALIGKPEGFSVCGVDAYVKICIH